MLHVSKSQYFFYNLNSNCSNLLFMRNLQEQVKKAFHYQELFWPLTVSINCSSDLKNFANFWPSASNFKSFSRSLEQFFLKVCQNNFVYKIPNEALFCLEKKTEEKFYALQFCQGLLCRINRLASLNLITSLAC